MIWLSNGSTITYNQDHKVVVNGKYSEEKQLTYSVPQVSCSGAYLFNLYCSKCNDVVPMDLYLSGFADDHSVRKEFKANDRTAELQTKKDVEECMVDDRSWIDWVGLKMNSAKTEFIYFGNRIQLNRCMVTHHNVNGEQVPSILEPGKMLNCHSRNTQQKVPDSNNQLLAYKKYLPSTYRVLVKLYY